MDRAKNHVNIPTELFINIHTLLDHLAIVSGNILAAPSLTLAVLKSNGTGVVAQKLKS